MKETKLILVNEDRDGMDKTPKTGNRTATYKVFIKNSTGNKLLHRELIKKELINSIDVNIMHFFHPSEL